MKPNFKKLFDGELARKKKDNDFTMMILQHGILLSYFDFSQDHSFILPT
jgi:hypothetical protein